MDDRLIFKLEQNGILGNLLKRFQNYLSNRKQRVVQNGSYSDYSSIESDVPQGSVLGPLLFPVLEFAQYTPSGTIQRLIYFIRYFFSMKGKVPKNDISEKTIIGFIAFHIWTLLHATSPGIYILALEKIMFLESRKDLPI
jgi:hypothetical protein